MASPNTIKLREARPKIGVKIMTTPNASRGAARQAIRALAKEEGVSYEEMKERAKNEGMLRRFHPKFDPPPVEKIVDERPKI